ncbi:hypothetical protein RJT34_22989 [Clitoria ternatea]|uniref:Uncharacterized protein n=1 Tax=Clitoria ternatea TaxID=43366 RepID=A0AAN9FTU3_CLITE
MNNITTRLPTRTHTPVLKASQVILLIQNEERRKTIERFMKNLGIKVKVVKEWTDLSGTLNNIKEQFSQIIEASSSTIGFLLMIIKASVGAFYDIFRMVFDFRRGLFALVVRLFGWRSHLYKVLTSTSLTRMFLVQMTLSCPSRFMHGARMFQVIRILPEYGGVCLLDSSSREWKGKGKVFSSDNDGGAQSVVHWQKGASSSGTKETDQQCHDATEEGKSTVQQGEIQVCGESSNNKDSSKVALKGMKILIVKDSPLLRRMAKATLEKLVLL